MGYLDHLECTRCGARYDSGELHNLCPSCGKILFARYDLERVREEVSRDALAERDPTMWRYREGMPLLGPRNNLTPREGVNPLGPPQALRREACLPPRFVEEERVNPTR